MYKYNHFIPQNIAPNNAKSIGVYDSNGNEVCSIPLGGLTPPNGEKLYSFGLVSDIHLWHLSAAWSPNPKFDNSLTYFENQGCKMCVISGDLTQTGFYRKNNESDSTETPYFESLQFAKYKEICDKHSIPIYELCGNHESYYNKSITENLDNLEYYTGKGVLSYTVTQGEDLFIFIGQPYGSTPMLEEDLQWLYEILEANRNRRCLIFIHPQFRNDSGNALGVYTSNQFFDSWNGTTVFKNLLCHYKNTILFHGHSHMMFECQEVDESANYTEKNGFKSVHIPSLSRPCSIVNGVRTYQNDKSYGYIVDIYDDCIMLNGIDFINNEFVPLGTYCIDTPIQVVEANTFTDSTETIVT